LWHPRSGNQKEVLVERVGVLVVEVAKAVEAMQVPSGIGVVVILFLGELCFCEGFIVALEENGLTRKMRLCKTRDCESG
jgi:hypothetical protein